jgi:hypothetical protein
VKKPLAALCSCSMIAGRSKDYNSKDQPRAKRLQGIHGQQLRAGYWRPIPVVNLYRAVFLKIKAFAGITPAVIREHSDPIDNPPPTAMSELSGTDRDGAAFAGPIEIHFNNCVIRPYKYIPINTQPAMTMNFDTHRSIIC